jgi:pimeloyl-ACP methyl ester carboxylesterase
MTQATSMVHADGELSGAINGMEMYYEVSGSGEPLVLLHWFNGSGQSWQRFVPELSKSYRVIVPDLRGHGRSTNPMNQFTHRQSALDVFALLDKLGITKFKGMGICTGGMTLLHMATQQPSRVESMVLIGATIYYPEQARQIMRKSTVESLTPRDYERMRRVHKHGDDQIRALRQQFYSFKDSYDDMNFTSPDLSTITAKTLLVHGDRDELFPVAIPIEMYRSIPNSFPWIIRNGGHVPIYDPKVPFVSTALDFLAGSWDSKRRSKALPPAVPRPPARTHSGLPQRLARVVRQQSSRVDPVDNDLATIAG